MFVLLHFRTFLLDEYSSSSHRLHDYRNCVISLLSRTPVALPSGIALSALFSLVLEYLT